MKRPDKIVFLLLACGVLLLPLAACDRDEGPAEEAGESLDEAVDDVKDAFDDDVESVEEAADELEDAAEEAGEEIEEAVDGGEAP